MSDSAAEAILKALFAALAAAAPAGAEVLRNAVLPKRLPAAGLIVLRDGDPGEPEVTLSPRLYHYEHRAELDLLVEEPEDDARDAAFDALRQAIAPALEADRTLGGLCDWLEAEAPAPQEFAPGGGDPIKAATVALVLHYATPDPLL